MKPVFSMVRMYSVPMFNEVAECAVLRDLSALDVTRQYQATVSSNPEWGAWTLRFNGHVWEAYGKYGAVLASFHHWEICG